MNGLVMNLIPGGVFWNAERFFQARTICGVAGTAHRFSKHDDFPGLDKKRSQHLKCILTNTLFSEQVASAALSPAGPPTLMSRWVTGQ